MLALLSQTATTISNDKCSRHRPSMAPSSACGPWWEVFLLRDILLGRIHLSMANVLSQDIVPVLNPFLNADIGRYTQC